MRRALGIVGVIAVAIAMLVSAPPSYASSAGTATRYPIGTTLAAPSTIAADPSGNLWFTDTGNLRIGKLSITGGVTYINTPQAPSGITYGPGGKLWFTESALAPANVASLDPATGAITEVTPSESIAFPSVITAGPDGNLWFIQIGLFSSIITRMTPSGQITTFTPGVSVASLVAGPDGNIWFTAPIAGKIGKITTDGAVTLTANGIHGAPNAITVGPNGNLWFTEAGSGVAVGQISTQPGAAATEVSVAGTVTQLPGGITAGPDGNVWFTLTGSSVSRITTSGALTAFAPTASPTAVPFGLATGPDGNQWALLTNSQDIAQIATGAVAPVVVSQASKNGLSSATFRGTMYPGGMSQVVTLQCATNRTFTAGLIERSVSGSPISGTAPVTVRGSCPKLASNTRYYARFLGANSAPGTSATVSLAYTTTRSFRSRKAALTIKQLSPVKHGKVLLGGTTRTSSARVTVYRQVGRGSALSVMGVATSRHGRWRQPNVDLGGARSAYFCARVGSQWSNTIRVSVTGRSRIADLHVTDLPLADRGDMLSCPRAG